MIVPNYQMDSLKIICAADVDNTIVTLDEVPKFEKDNWWELLMAHSKELLGGSQDGKGNRE